MLGYAQSKGATVRKIKANSGRATAMFLLVAMLAIPTGARRQNPLPLQQRPAAAEKPQSPPPEQTFVLLGAGDIASCKEPEGALATAKMIEGMPGTVFALGDLAYEAGSAQNFELCYGPTWGRFKDRTMPALGNHEYQTPGARGYFNYWKERAGPEGKGYYSYELGSWHIVVLNTNCLAPGLGGCAAGSPQELWLKEDLAKHPAACILAYGHHPLLSSGVFKKHAIHPELKPLWQDLFRAHADLVLAGHEHAYERFVPVDPDGNADPQNGIREIVAGMGGRSHDPLGAPLPGSEVQNWETFGVLKLVLSPGKYTWEFVPEPGKTFRDSGSAACHNLPAAP